MSVSVEQAVTLLKIGEVVAIPTETVYGLAGSIHNENALKKIFSTKERPFFDPLIVHIASASQLSDIADTPSESAMTLAKALWPGPLTLILKKKPSISDLITAGLPDVGVRCPRHPLALEILKHSGPLAAPSANKFGKTSPTLAAHVESEFLGQVPVVDGGACEIGIESTVLRVVENETEIQLSVLRPGAVQEKELREALKTSTKKIIFKNSVPAKISAAAPGQLENHYQPTKPLVLADHSVSWNPQVHQQICQSLSQTLSSDVSHWSFNDTVPQLVARVLYAEMRQKSAEKTSYIFLNLPSNYDDSDWEAVRDRLEKASSLRLNLSQNIISPLVKGK